VTRRRRDRPSDDRRGPGLGAAPPSARPRRSCAVQGIVAELSGCSRGAAAYGGVGYPKLIACKIANETPSLNTQWLYTAEPNAADRCSILPRRPRACASGAASARRSVTTPPRLPPRAAGSVTTPPRPPPRAAGNSPIWQFEDPISTCNSMITMKVLVIRRASANSPSQPHVLGEDCDALGVDGAQHRVFEKLNDKSLRCFLECQQGPCLKTDIALEILAEFSHQTLKWPHP